MIRLVASLMVGLVLPGVSLGQSSGQLAVPGGAKRFVFADEAVFPVIAMPGRITDIILEPGETLVGSGPVAAGDTFPLVFTIEDKRGKRSPLEVRATVRPIGSR